MNRHSRLAAAKALLTGTVTNAEAEAINLYNLGVRTGEARHYDTALTLWKRAHRINPRDQRIIENIVASLAFESRFDEAAEYLSVLAPESYHHDYCAGQRAWSEGRLEDAIAHMARVKDHPRSSSGEKVAYPISLLLAGRWLEGWKAYEPHLTRSKNAAPTWDGARVKRLLVFWEQGQGDIIMFARYVKWAAARADKVYVHMPVYLVQVLAGYQQFAQMIDDPQAVEVDAQIGMHALPGVHGTTPQTALGLLNVVRFFPVPVARTRRKKIGIVWQGNDYYAQDRTRSMAFALMLRLAENPDIQLYSLQLGAKAGDIVGAGAQGIVTDLSGICGMEWAYTAGAINEMDAIVSVDTAVAHLAASMGKRTYICMRRVPDWRWGFEGETTPWYPAARIVRQTKPGDWAGVIERVAERLAAL